MRKFDGGDGGDDGEELPYGIKVKKLWSEERGIGRWEGTWGVSF